MKTTLDHIASGNDMSHAQSKSIMAELMEGKFSDIEIGEFLMALKGKGETATEIAGFVEALREKATPITLDTHSAIDCCGTGGDGSGSFNISTASAIVAAAAGAKIAKHGNRSVSSKCGSADLLEKAGVQLDKTPDNVAKDFGDIGICFMFAPVFHPAIRFAMPARKALGVRTVFNMLGPLLNPAGVTRQLLGVYAADVMELFADTLLEIGCKRALIVHSRDGLDEISALQITDCIELADGKKRILTIDPSECGLDSNAPAVEAGGPDDNLQILVGLLRGFNSIARQATLINSAAILYLSDLTPSIASGVKLAKQSIDSGAARELLTKWSRS